MNEEVMRISTNAQNQNTFDAYQTHILQNGNDVENAENHYVEPNEKGQVVESPHVNQNYGRASVQGSDTVSQSKSDTSPATVNDTTVPAVKKKKVAMKETSDLKQLEKRGDDEDDDKGDDEDHSSPAPTDNPGHLNDSTKLFNATTPPLNDSQKSTNANVQQQENKRLLSNQYNDV